MSDAVEQAAERLIRAAMDRVPCAPVRDLFDHGTIDDGYAVQRRVLERVGAGHHRVGRKIGLTSPVVQRQMGVDQPDFGVLFADMAYGDAQPVPADRLLQPRVEAEVAFVLGRDLPYDRPVTVADVLRATELVVAAIEVVDSRIRDWDISILDTVADNASSGVFVLGAAPRSLTDLDDLGAARMRMTCDGDEVAEGRGADCLGHPVNAVRWLADAVGQRGEPLREGEVILSGSLGRLVPVEAGRTYEATIEGLGTVRAVFEP